MGYIMGIPELKLSDEFALFTIGHIVL